MAARLILASASPRRHELLRSIGVGFEVVPADIDETELDREPPLEYVTRVAAAKARAVVGRSDVEAPGGVVIIAADTTVDLDGAILAKPADDDEARTMLRALSGRWHRVHTAVCGWAAAGERAVTVTTDVRFVEITDELLNWYLAIGEHRDKAGSYGMQGAGGVLVERIDGSPSNVIGLPLAETIDLLRALRFDPSPHNPPIS